jgi:hypothetical protein
MKGYGNSLNYQMGSSIASRCFASHGTSYQGPRRYLDIFYFHSNSNYQKKKKKKKDFHSNSVHIKAMSSDSNLMIGYFFTLINC